MDKNNRFKTRILLNSLYWLIGLIVIFILWIILSQTTFKNNGELPDPLKSFSTVGNLLGQENSWSAIFIAFGQTLAAFVGSFIICVPLIILGAFYKPIKYVFSPFVTFGRVFPTAILTILLLVFCPIALISIIVSFFIIFPMTYENLYWAINNINSKKREMAKIFKLNKKDIIINIYLKSLTPYIFSSLIASFGLGFKVVLASQVIINTSPGYDSIGWFIVNAKNNKQYDVIIAWGIIVILFSLFWELVMKETSRICMPYKYKDLFVLKKILKINA